MHSIWHSIILADEIPFAKNPCASRAKPLTEISTVANYIPVLLFYFHSGSLFAPASQLNYTYKQKLQGRIKNKMKKIREKKRSEVNNNIFSISQRMGKRISQLFGSCRA